MSTLRHKEVKLKTAQSARGRTSSPQPEHNQLREHGAARDDPERALRSYVQQFQKKANHSLGGAASSNRSSKDENSVKVSRGSPAIQREDSDKSHKGSGYYTRRLESAKKELRQ